MKTSKTGQDFIKGFESFVPHVYDDMRPPVKGKYRAYKPSDDVLGTLTVLYGHTDAARHPLRIADCIGKTFTEEFAQEVLAVDLSECEEDVARLVKKPLTQGQFDACVSFCFNCGAGNFANIAKRINAGNFTGARSAFDLYVKSKGQTLRGLQRRRDGEQVLWDSDIPTVPAEPVDHPAEVDLPPKISSKDLAKKSSPLAWIRNAKRTVISAGISGVMAAIALAKQVTADIGEVIGQHWLALLISGCVLVMLFLMYVESAAVEEANEGETA